MNITALSKDELESRQQSLEAKFEALKSQNLALDLTRGKPSKDQLDLANDLDGILKGFYLLQDGTDVRNYGGILGIPEARQLGADLLGTDVSEIMCGGNSSLTLMYQYIESMMPVWNADGSTDIKFLCPVPGYDRHFTICEHFNIEMIPVAMDAHGPDMNQVEQLTQADASIKGIWCVPRYSNPTGCTYSDEVVKRFAALPKQAGKDFRIFWDNAYVVHHLTDTPDPLSNLMTAAHEQGTSDNVVMLASTSKVTFAGAGIAFLATSATNLTAFEKFLSVQAIGFDKVNQLRHVRFLENLEGVQRHMDKHRALLAPRFACVAEKLDALKDSGIAEWTDPNGGYFVSLDTMPGVASSVVELAAEAGVKLTPAGATFPYGNDPDNRNIRLAPTFPGVDELSQAMDVFVVCLELASVNHLLGEKG